MNAQSLAPYYVPDNEILNLHQSASDWHESMAKGDYFNGYEFPMSDYLLNTVWTPCTARNLQRRPRPGSSATTPKT